MRIGIGGGWRDQPHTFADCRNADDWAELLSRTGGGGITFSLHGQNFYLSALDEQHEPRPSWDQVISAIRNYATAYLPGTLNWGDYIDSHEIDGADPVPEHHPAPVSLINQFAGAPDFIRASDAHARGWRTKIQTQRYCGFYLLFEQGAVWARSVSAINHAEKPAWPLGYLKYHTFARSTLRGTHLTIAESRLPVHGHRAGIIHYRQSDWDAWAAIARREIDAHHAGAGTIQRVYLYDDLDVLDLIEGDDT